MSATRTPYRLPTVGIATTPNGYTLEREIADIRHGLHRTRVLIRTAIDTATVYQSTAEDPLWTALRYADADCVDAGLASWFSADGMLLP